MNKSLEQLNSELEALRKEVEELRTFKLKWDAHYPGLLPEAVKQMEEQLYHLYNEKDEAADLATTYQTSLDKS